jgi:hypothetical protein
MLCSLELPHVKAAHESNGTTTAQRRKALATSARSEGLAMTDPKPSLKLLVSRLTTQTDNALGTLGDFKGALENLTVRAAELEGLNQQIEAAKNQLATLKAQLDVGWGEFEKMKAAHSKISTELGVVGAQYQNIVTRINAV